VEKQANRDHKHNTKYSLNRFTIPPKCEVCDSTFIIGGPIWTGEIHDSEFIEGLLTRIKSWEHLGTHKRIKKTIGAIKQEMSIGNIPLSYEFDKIISEIRSESIPRHNIVSAFRSLNYDLVQTYYKPTLYKTNVSNQQVYDVFKAWKKKLCDENNRGLLDKCTGTDKKILEKPIEVEPDFDFESEEVKKFLKKNKVCYNSNPPNWGPGSKANSVMVKEKKATKKAKEKEEEENEGE
jgi:tRNA (guanine26-N2/guanine27-N2)-dimethyltransferase